MKKSLSLLSVGLLLHAQALAGFPPVRIAPGSQPYLHVLPGQKVNGQQVDFQESVTNYTQFGANILNVSADGTDTGTCGKLMSPCASLPQAMSNAGSLASATTPVNIMVGPGVFPVGGLVQLSDTYITCTSFATYLDFQGGSITYDPVTFASGSGQAGIENCLTQKDSPAVFDETPLVGGPAAAQFWYNMVFLNSLNFIGGQGGSQSFGSGLLLENGINVSAAVGGGGAEMFLFSSSIVGGNYTADSTNGVVYSIISGSGNFNNIQLLNAGTYANAMYNLGMSMAGQLQLDYPMAIYYSASIGVPSAGNIQYTNGATAAQIFLLNDAGGIGLTPGNPSSWPWTAFSGFSGTTLQSAIDWMAGLMGFTPTGPSQPTCSAANRGQQWLVPGPPDILQVCQNTTGSTYVWVTH